MDCLFCKIINGEVPSYKVYEDDIVYAFLDINPFGTGHTLIIPKKHYLNIEDIDNDTYFHIVEITKKLALEYKDKLHMDGYSICQNNGCAQEIKHFHMHLIPKYENEKKLSIEEVYNILKENR